MVDVTNRLRTVTAGASLTQPASLTRCRSTLHSPYMHAAIYRMLMVMTFLTLVKRGTGPRRARQVCYGG